MAIPPFYPDGLETIGTVRPDDADFLAQAQAKSALAPAAAPTPSYALPAGSGGGDACLVSRASVQPTIMGAQVSGRGGNRRAAVMQDK